MRLSRFEPWNLVSVLHRDMDRFAARRQSVRSNLSDNDSGTGWIPAVDVVEEENRFILRADVPGVKAEDISINTEKGILSVSGSRALDIHDEAETVQLQERSRGAFDRRFTLPESADEDNISAVCSDGILEVVIPRLPEVKARRITVKAA